MILLKRISKLKSTLFLIFFNNQRMLESYLFICFTVLILFSSVMVISAKNPVHSVLFLICTFTVAAGMMFMLEVEFISLIFIIVYVGAIAVLFLFVVMMLDIKISESKQEFLKYFPIGSFLGVAFFIEIFVVLAKNFESNFYFKSDNFYVNWFTSIDYVTLFLTRNFHDQFLVQHFH